MAYLINIIGEGATIVNPFLNLYYNIENEIKGIKYERY